MQGMYYDIFIDESGNFSDAHPSLIGGIFCSAGQLTQEQARQMLLDSLENVDQPFPANGWIHSTDLPRDVFPGFALCLLENMLSEGIQPFVIENQERVEIVDSDTTYLHMVAEGITRLLSVLSSANTRTTLRVIAARRMTEDERHESALKVIPRGEYLPRIHEHMVTAMLRLGVWEYSDRWSLADFSLGSAREDYRLMLADLICHAWYSRYTKFGEKDRTCLEHYLGGCCFTVVEKGVLAALARKKNEGAFGEALFVALEEITEMGIKPTSANQQQLAYRLGTEIERLVELLAGMPRFGLQRNIEALLGSVDSLVVQRDYGKARMVLQEMLQRVLEPLRNHLGDHFAGLDWVTLKIASQLLAIENHRGCIHTLKDVLDDADKSLTKLAQRFENLDLVIGYLNRKVVYLNNSYAFADALEQIDRLIQFHEGVMSLYPIELPQLFAEGLKSDVLGKLYGNRVQILTFLARKDPEWYELARETSDRAIQEFEAPDDICRQYLYRCQLETDAGDFQAAWRSLVRGTVYGADELSPDELAGYLKEDPDGRKVFALAHYCRLMAASISADDHWARDLADGMKQAWDSHRLDEYPLFRNGFAEHPMEIIKWKKGSYYLAVNQIKRGLEHHQQALGICFKDPDRFTLYTIGLGILVEQAGLLLRLNNKNYCHALERAAVHTSKFLKNPHLPKAMRDYFAHWPKTLAKTSSSEELLDLAREVPY